MIDMREKYVKNKNLFIIKFLDGADGTGDDFDAHFRKDSFKGPYKISRTFTFNSGDSMFDRVWRRTSLNVYKNRSLIKKYLSK